MKNDLIIKDTAHHYREIRKILRGSSPIIEEDEPIDTIYILFFSMFVLIVLAFLITMTIIFMEGTARAYTEDHAVKVIVGEASNQSFKGMVAIGEALRNRGTLKGCYGLNDLHSRYEPKWVWIMAKKAYYASKTSHLTHGATGWGNAKDLISFKHHSWFKHCIITAHIKDHWFYISPS